MKCVDSIRTGENIRELMKKQNISESDIARALQVSCQSVSKWVHGKSYPTLDNLVLLSRVLKVRISDILVEL